MILSFTESDPDAVYLDAATGGLYIESPRHRPLLMDL